MTRKGTIRGGPTFARTTRLVAVVHLEALPGSPGFAGSMERVHERALQDSDRLVDAGFDGLIVENFGDAPFFKESVPPVTVAAMAAVLERIRARHRSVPLGVNVLRNDVASALSLAAVAGADFVRVNVHVGASVTDQGLIEGRAAETLRLRAALAPRTAILADFRVKHAAPLVERPWEEELGDLLARGRAEAVLLTGGRTGSPPDPTWVGAVRRVARDHPLFVASGVTAETVGSFLRHADGVIVGSAVEKGGVAGRPVAPDRARAFVAAARSAGDARSSPVRRAETPTPAPAARRPPRASSARRPLRAADEASPAKRGSGGRK